MVHPSQQPRRQRQATTKSRSEGILFLRATTMTVMIGILLYSVSTVLLHWKAPPERLASQNARAQITTQSSSLSSSSLHMIQKESPVARALHLFRSGRTAVSATNQTQEKEGITHRHRHGHGHGHTNARLTSHGKLTYPVPEPMPNPPLADGYDTFSACVLVMDDNHRLAEWLPYHYHVLPLRTMIVVNDPRAQTSPQFLLNRWREMGMHIIEWNDQDFWKNDLQPIEEDAPFQKKRDRHRGRQKYFYRKCLIHLKDLNRTWVALHDTDEYLVYNHAGGDKFEPWEARMEKRQYQVQGTKVKRVKPSQTPPTTAQEGQMIKYIRQEQQAEMQYFQSPCIGVPRLSFGAIPSNSDSTVSRKMAKYIPSFVQERQFDTLQWRRHAHRNDFTKNALGKVLIDVSRVDMRATPFFMSLHRPIKTICSAPWHKDWDSGLRINHYLGSWESYAFRDDSRRGGERSREQWEYKASFVDETDDNIRPWIGGFVEKHGEDKAKELLQDVGLPSWYQNPNSSQWDMLPEKLEEVLQTDEKKVSDVKLLAFADFVKQKYKQS